MAVIEAARNGSAAAVRERLEAFGAEVLAEAMNRPVQMANGGLYLRGLLEQGTRKSLEPMVARLGEDADYQSMQQFLADSPWDPALVVRRWPSGWLPGDRGRGVGARRHRLPQGRQATRRGSSASTRARWARSATVRSASRCTRSAPRGRCRWAGRSTCPRSGARMQSGGARRRSPTRSSSRPSPSSGSSWSSAPPAGRCRRRRCSATTPTATTPSCASASTPPGPSTCSRSPPRRPCSSPRPPSRCPAPKRASGRPPKRLAPTASRSRSASSSPT